MTRTAGPSSSALQPVRRLYITPAYLMHHGIALVVRLHVPAWHGAHMHQHTIKRLPQFDGLPGEGGPAQRATGWTDDINVEVTQTTPVQNTQHRIQ